MNFAFTIFPGKYKRPRHWGRVAELYCGYSSGVFLEWLLVHYEVENAHHPNGLF